MGAGTEALRRLTWRIVYRGSCFYLTLTISQRFARSQLALNGCVLETRKHGVLAQVLLACGLIYNSDWQHVLQAAVLRA